MTYLYELIQQKVTDWRSRGYPTEGYPAVAEILDYATLPESEGLRYLRQAQLRALETYWYLRLVEGTPHVFELYQRYYARPLDLRAASGLDRDEIKDVEIVHCHRNREDNPSAYFTRARVCCGGVPKSRSRPAKIGG
jgi:type III restriction enzyme